MTEASENVYLVRVRAQVMCRDEGTGGWVALGGGGLADVMVGKRHPASAVSEPPVGLPLELRELDRQPAAPRPHADAHPRRHHAAPTPP
ncbi:hypothetical protein MSG28_015792 [Choristoneura fumiferana]|uniref:Uncharacterized protein n=1 Tax=Choristoneura fumiferana TaxID=7141 RepID=A0ACC0KBE1_CHOFU|nr:hypothetical protein MSG28_015792 [Choristoneura fumiferana]